MSSRRKNLREAKPLPVQPRPRDIVRLLGNVILSDQAPDGFRGPCWLWQGGRDDAGYGYIKLAGEKRWVHRVSYEVFRGPCPRGMEVDHGCHCPNCINPEHLAPKDPLLNRRLRRPRGSAPGTVPESRRAEAAFAAAAPDEDVWQGGDDEIPF